MKTGEKQLKIELIRKKSSDTITGGPYSFLAVKNESSYLVSTLCKGYQLVEKGRVLYIGILGEVHNIVYGMKYISKMDFYMIVINHKLYVKRIDDRPPCSYLTFDLEYGSLFKPDLCTMSLRRSNKAFLLMMQGDGNLLVVDLVSERFQNILQFQGKNQGKIRMFRLLGDEVGDDRPPSSRFRSLVGVTAEENLVLTVIEPGMRRVLFRKVCKIQVKLEGGDPEMPVSLSTVITATKKHLVCIQTATKYRALSRVLIFGVSLERGFEAFSVLDLRSRNLYSCLFFEYLILPKNSDFRKIFFVGFDNSKGRLILIEYQSEDKSLRLSGVFYKTVTGEEIEEGSLSLCVVNSSFYFIANGCNLYRGWLMRSNLRLD